MNINPSCPVLRSFSAWNAVNVFRHSCHEVFTHEPAKASFSQEDRVYYQRVRASLPMCCWKEREIFLNFQKCVGNKASESLSCSILNLRFHTWKYNSYGGIYTLLTFSA